MRKATECLVSALSRSDIACAYLFGSRATGTARASSDWDVAVLLTRWPGNEAIWEKFKIEDDLAIALATDAVQVIILNTLDDPLLGFEIINTGQLLIERDQEARLLFEANTLRRYQDWQYWLNRHLETPSRG